ncbi:thermonuclease family protein [Roseibium sp. RKSG952]|uniref:thermonuclease family protein n=1 Tax=Roseibium sp. RKSG952 TaxID=2529384 RepID=UPI0012BC428C|nr:thermonuclease family protein [Roseibium sp. RKSG952]MTH95402.1 thermonuclease family protein [Roseibium sp. RKSG952]
MTSPLQKTLVTAACLSSLSLPAISQSVSPGFDAFDAGSAPSSFSLPSPTLSVPSSAAGVASPSLPPSPHQVAPSSAGNAFQGSDIVARVPTAPVFDGKGSDGNSSTMPASGVVISGVPSLTGNGFFFLAGVPVRLSGVAVPPSGELCRTSSGTEWMCGRSSGSRLSMLFEGKKTSCRVVKSYPDGVTGVCSSGTVFDIGRLMISEGWAVPVGSEGLRYSSESLSARESRSGLWSGSFKGHSSW